MPSIRSSCLTKATLGTSFDALALEAGILVLHRTVNIRKIIFSILSPSEHCTDSRLKQTPIFLRISPSYLKWSFSLRDRLQVSHTPRGYKGTPRELKQGDIPCACP